ncbi:hypothetical protein FRB95_009772 [Tulasnella sp. JGI-2019a]|nr:hypothetical protein FRB95_009772 [Tulasnella sp. JGI-2019a]
MNTTNHSVSSSSSAASSLYDTPPDTTRSSTSSSSQPSRPLKRTAGQSQVESLTLLPPAKRVKQQAATRGDNDRALDEMQHEEEDDSRKVDEQLMDGVEEEGEQGTASRIAEQEVKGNVQADKALKYADNMEDELRCGCCTELLYRPVVVTPCGHYFCGSCCVLWVRNGGTSCPACRQPSTSISPSRLLEGFIEVLLQTYPEKQRTQAERDQADEVYQTSSNISIPPPRSANAEGALLPQSRSHDPPPDHLARPCPHCLPNNEFGWRCPHPLADPATDAAHAWNLDNGTPPGHAWCGYCDELHATGSPSTSRCSICTTSFCGLSVPSLCVANHMGSALLPVAVSNLTGIIQSQDVYEAFSGNAIEVEVLFDWLREDGRGPRGMLLDMVENIRNTQDGFQKLIDAGVFIRSDEDDMAAPPPINQNALMTDPASAIDGDDEDDDEDDEPIVEETIVVPIPEDVQVVLEAAAVIATAPATSVTNAENTVPAAPVPVPEPIPQVLEDARATSPMPAPPTPPPVPTPVPAATSARTFSRICRECAHSLFIARVYDWWAEERAEVVASYEEGQQQRQAGRDKDKDAGAVDGAEGVGAIGEVTGSGGSGAAAGDGEEKFDGLPVWVLDSAKRKDCELGRHCGRQYETSHAKEFNHIIAPPRPAPLPSASEDTSGAANPTLSSQEPTVAGETTRPPSNILPMSSSNVDEAEHIDQVMEDLPTVSINNAQEAPPAAHPQFTDDVEMSIPVDGVPETLGASSSSNDNVNAIASTGSQELPKSESVLKWTSSGSIPSTEVDQDAPMEDADRDAIAVERSLVDNSIDIATASGGSDLTRQMQDVAALVTT